MEESQWKGWNGGERFAEVRLSFSSLLHLANRRRQPSDVSPLRCGKYIPYDAKVHLNCQGNRANLNDQVNYAGSSSTE
jgi:hypothetical protein